jgi:hypothetical protein
MLSFASEIGVNSISHQLQKSWDEIRSSDVGVLDRTQIPCDTVTLVLDNGGAALANTV